jgi:hypothetical protein
MSSANGAVQLKPMKMSELTKSLPTTTTSSPVTTSKYVIPSKRAISEEIPVSKSEKLDFNDKSFPSLGGFGGFLSNPSLPKKNFKQKLVKSIEGQANSDDEEIVDEMDCKNLKPSQLLKAGWYPVPRYTGPKTTIYL